MNDSQDYELAVIVALESLFNELERLTLWNAAYRHAMQIGGDPTELRTEAEQFAAKDQYPRGIEKYIDLRKRAIQAVQGRNLDEFSALVPQVKARIAAWNAESMVFITIGANSIYTVISASLTSGTTLARLPMVSGRAR